jgi:anti-sigma factor RsiW
MTIRRAIIPLIVALGAAGSILAGSTAPAVAAQAPAAHALATAAHVTPYTYAHA